MGVGVAADVDQQRRVVDDRALLLVEPDPLGEPQRDQALPQHVLHRLPEAEVDAERQRGDELREPDVRAIGLAGQRLFHPAGHLSQRLQSGTVHDELVSQSIELPGGELSLLQPMYAAELPDAGAVEWAPLAPYWAVLWRSGVALARELEDAAARRPARGRARLRARRFPSIAAARAGARVLATDACPEALTLVARNAHANDVQVETERVDWAEPDGLVSRGPFDLALAADVLYERASRPRCCRFCRASHRRPGSPIRAAPRRTHSSSRRAAAGRSRRAVRGVVQLHRLRLG